MARVGVTYATVELSNPRRPDRAAHHLELLVDTGAFFSVVPASVLEALGVSRMERQTFQLADGTRRTYEVGEATFAFGGRPATSKVVFAPEGVTPLLGALTLESLGLMVDPVTRELLPMRLMLAAVV